MEGDPTQMLPPDAVTTRTTRGGSRAVGMMKVAVLLVLLTASILVSLGVHLYAKDAQIDNFERDFFDKAHKIIHAFHDSVEYKLGVLNMLSNTFTSYAATTNQTFPFVYLPHFSLYGADARVLAGSYVIHYLPIVTDDTRSEWEDFAFKNRHRFDDEFALDSMLRNQQDEAYITTTASSSSATITTKDPPDRHSRVLQDDNKEDKQPAKLNETIEEDGFHSKIWNVGAMAPRGDQPEGTGPYLPVWQSSPVSPVKSVLNMDFSKTFALKGVLEEMQTSHQAVLYKAAIPIPRLRNQLASNLKLGQYRGSPLEEYLDDPTSFLTYPVFDRVDQNEPRRLVGMLATPLYWRLVLASAGTVGANRMICVLENSFNQTLTYEIDGSDVRFLGMEKDLHDPKYDSFQVSANVNSYLQERAGLETQSYTTVSLQNDYGTYKLHVYPSDETKAFHTDNSPVIYALIITAAFVLPSIVFLLFSHVVDRRQRMITDSAIANAKKALETEREMNELLSHEVRNPLSAAMSACSFLSSTLNVSATTAPLEQVQLDAEELRVLRGDVVVIDHNLTFINDFLRTMLDLHRSRDKKIQLNLTHVDVRTCIFDPIVSMMCVRDLDLKIEVDCPNDLVIMTDPLRLKQVVLNLVVNAAKFVTTGYIRMRAVVLNTGVQISVEDSGPGLEHNTRDALFQKFQSSLDAAGQGTGLDLSLCKNLVTILGGTIWLDESFRSGIEGFPGARFVFQLESPPIKPEQKIEESPDTKTSFSPINALECTPELSTIPGLPSRYSVLFVDDDRVLRKLFVRAVSKVAPDWSLKEAASGEAAILMTEEESFDLIFMDQYMAGTTKQLLGTESIRKMRSLGVMSIICGLSANDLEGAFLNAGAEHFLLKPIPCKQDELLPLLHSIVGDDPHTAEVESATSSQQSQAYD